MSEAVCIPSDKVLDLLTALVDASLVVYEGQPDGTGRYRLLETTRQYAGEKLKENGEDAAVRERHQAFFVALAEEAEPQLVGSEQGMWLERLEQEHDNLRAALVWCGEAEDNVRTGIRLAKALVWFWNVRGYYSEGRTRLSNALSQVGTNGRKQERAWALNGAGLLAFSQGDTASARSHYVQSQTIFRELGDKEGIAVSLNNLGHVAFAEGEYSLMRSLNEESLAIFQETENKWGIAHTLGNLGLAAFSQGDYASARSLYEQSLEIFRASQNQWGIAYALGCLGNSVICQGDAITARSLYTESLVILSAIGNKRGLAYSLEAFAHLAATKLQRERAVRLWGAAERLREEIGSPLPPNERDGFDREADQSRTALSEQAFAAAWAEGRAMTMEQAIAYVLREAGGE
jgi:tetratricopeptide (TPR) repeat protein